MVVAVKHVADDSFSRSLGRRNGCIFLGRLSRHSPLSSFVRTHVCALERESYRIASHRYRRRASPDSSARARVSQLVRQACPFACHASPMQSTWVHRSFASSGATFRGYILVARAQRERIREKKGGKKRPQSREGREAGKKGNAPVRRDGYTTHAPVTFADIFVLLDGQRLSEPPANRWERVSITIFERTCMYVSMYACRFPESSWLVAIVADDRARRWTVRLRFTGRAASIERFTTTLRQPETPGLSNLNSTPLICAGKGDDEEIACIRQFLSFSHRSHSSFPLFFF